MRDLRHPGPGEPRLRPRPARFSFSVNLLAPLSAGAALILAQGVRPHRLPAFIQASRPTLAFITSAQADAVAAFQVHRPADLSSLRRLWCGGAPLDSMQSAHFTEATGLELLQGYGLTEAFVVCANPWEGAPSSAGTSRPETLGLPMPCYKLRVASPDGSPLPDGIEGELQVAGPAVMSGYLGEPEATAQALDGPWLRTGDRTTRHPDGHFHFTGWDKAIIKTLGFVVDLKEVEATLLDLLPLGSIVRLSTNPRPRWGHQLAAEVECPAPAPTVDQLRAQLAQRLSFYKIPDPLQIITL